MKKFCIDTSGWMDGWIRDYPPDVFPSLWEKLDESIDRGEIIASEEVYTEVAKKDDDLHSWMKSRKKMLIPITEEIQGVVSLLLADHPRLVDTHRNRSQADPFVIATAQEEGAIVVTGEQPRGKLDKPRIPDICDVKKIQWMSFLEMLREIGWKF